MSNGKVNSNTNYLKFINFSINNILVYSKQLMNDKTDKQIIKLVAKMIKQMQPRQRQQQQRL